MNATTWICTSRKAPVEPSHDDRWHVGSVVYAPMPGGKWFILAMFGVFAIAAVALLATTLAGGRDAPPPAFAALWLAALGWNGYWWLFRIAAELRIDGFDLVWSTPLRNGRVSLSQLDEIRPMRFASNVAVLKVRDGQSIIVPATKGFRQVTTEIAQRRADLPIRLGWQARLAERLPGWNRFKRP